MRWPVMKPASSEARKLTAWAIAVEDARGTAIGTDAATDLMSVLVAVQAIDRDGETVRGQTPRDHGPQPPRAARHQSHAPLCHRHDAIISLRTARQALVAFADNAQRLVGSPAASRYLETARVWLTDGRTDRILMTGTDKGGRVSDD